MDTGCQGLTFGMTITEYMERLLDWSFPDARYVADITRQFTTSEPASAIVAASCEKQLQIGFGNAHRPSQAVSNQFTVRYPAVNRSI